MAARLKEKYHAEIKQGLQKELGLGNPMAVPALDKIVINMGLGEATQNVKIMDPLVADLAAIAESYVDRRGHHPLREDDPRSAPPEALARYLVRVSAGQVEIQTSPIPLTTFNS